MVNFPDDTQRLLEIGRTGSGKTQAACNELSFRSFDAMPWVIFDTKGDPFINKISQIEGVKILKMNEQPGKNGLYIVRPRVDEEEETDEFLWRIHSRGRVGLYFDEGYMIRKTDALNASLTQGRSKRIPIILLAQRPAWLTKFAFTEADFFQIFHLNNKQDRKTVQEFIPGDRADLETRLREYYSLWYDVKSDQITEFRPVPPADEILQTFKARLVPERVYI